MQTSLPAVLAVDPGDEHNKPWCCISICSALIICVIVAIVLIVVFARGSGSSTEEGQQSSRDTGELRLRDIPSCGELVKALGDPATQLGAAYWEPQDSQWFQEDRAWNVSKSQSIIVGGNANQQARTFWPYCT